MTTKSTPQSRHHMTPIVTDNPNLARYANTILEVQTASAKCEEAIVALGKAQQSLKPGPLGRFLARLEADLAVHVDNQTTLVCQLQDLIEARIKESEGQPE